MIQIENDVQPDAIASEIRWAAPIVAEVACVRVDGGWEAHLTLDDAMVRARAGQQGIRDRSVSAAAADPRLQQALANSISRANARLDADSQIVHHLIVIS